jgi:hypothetical protein
MVEQRRVTAVSDDPGMAPRSTVVQETTRSRPSGAELLRRIIVFIFAVIQGLLVLRIVLLLVDANRGNDLVRFIYDASGIFVAPFEGILHANAVNAGASVLDIAALVAIVGWTILEALLVAAVGIGRRETA